LIGALARFRSSGLSVRAFCDRELLSEPSFYAWRAETGPACSAKRRPGQRPGVPQRPRFVPLRLVAEPEANPGQERPRHSSWREDEFCASGLALIQRPWSEPSPSWTTGDAEPSILLKRSKPSGFGSLAEANPPVKRRVGATKRHRDFDQKTTTPPTTSPPPSVSLLRSPGHDSNGRMSQLIARSLGRTSNSPGLGNRPFVNLRVREF
jgi:hypothetical protein